MYVGSESVKEIEMNRELQVEVDAEVVGRALDRAEVDLNGLIGVIGYALVCVMLVVFVAGVSP